MKKFQLQHRSIVTISRLKLWRANNFFQLLSVKTPHQAAEDIEPSKTQGITIWQRTVFPTGTEDYWRLSNSAFPKRAATRMTNLPALCSDDELEELLDSTSLHYPLAQMSRERRETEFGPKYTGRETIPILSENWEFHYALHE